MRHAAKMHASAGILIGLITLVLGCGLGYNVVTTDSRQFQPGFTPWSSLLLPRWKKLCKPWMIPRPVTFDPHKITPS